MAGCGLPALVAGAASHRGPGAERMLCVLIWARPSSACGQGPRGSSQGPGAKEGRHADPLPQDGAGRGPREMHVSAGGVALDPRTCCPEVLRGAGQGALSVALPRLAAEPEAPRGPGWALPLVSLTGSMCR